jgi:hypothetical protein
MGTALTTVTEESADEEHTSKLLENVVSRLGLEPRALALKGRVDGFTQGLGFAKVSPFLFANNDLR